VLAPLMAAAGPMATWITAGLGERYGWPQLPSPAAQIAGVILFAAGPWLVIRAMSSNNFFSSVVRIQRERGHTVASGGPYQLCPSLSFWDRTRLSFRRSRRWR